MSQRQFTEVSDKVRKEVKDRDKHCIACGSHYNLTVAHVYINRSHGGLGIPENLCVLCMDCHHNYDNGKKTDQEYTRMMAQSYMYGVYGFPNFNKIKYNKYMEDIQ